MLHGHRHHRRTRDRDLATGERLNGIQAAARAGIEIPALLLASRACRWWEVAGCAWSRPARAIRRRARSPCSPKLVPACNTPAKDGTVIVTNSEKVQQARAMVEEDLLLRHPIDCPICDKAGECRSAGLPFPVRPGPAAGRHPPVHQPPPRRGRRDHAVRGPLRHVQPLRPLHPRDQRHGRADGHAAAGPTRRSTSLPGFPLDNKLSGNVVDLCPVGALVRQGLPLSAAGLVHAARTPGVCTGCATGCSIWIDENQDRVCRIKPRENPQVNKWWICNDGRYDYPPRPQRPAAQRPPSGATATRPVDVDWTAIVGELAGGCAEAGRLAAVLSPLPDRRRGLPAGQVRPRQLDPQAALVLGPVPVVGQDERFPSGFTIAAEKCPNRRGVEDDRPPFRRHDCDLRRVARGRRAGRRARSAACGSPADTSGATGSTRRPPRGSHELPLLIVQDLFASPLSDGPPTCLPARPSRSATAPM